MFLSFFPYNLQINVRLVTSTLMYQVWVIQVFTDLDPLCRHIAPAWEEAGENDRYN